MKEWQVFKHLETCTGPTPKPRRTIASSSSSSFSQHRQQTPTLERLPAINYSMYKDQSLRKKMSDLGISNQGPRTLLERRHKEWMTIWNSNCDAAQPRKHRELLQDLETWEKTQGGRAPTAGRSAQNAAIIKDKDFDGAAWAAKHDASFTDLINQARKTRLEARRKAEAAAKESKAETTPSLSQEPTNVDHPQPNHSTVEKTPNLVYTSPSEGQTRNDDSRGLIAPDPTNSTFIGLPSSTAEMSADPSLYTAIPNGHSQVPPQPQFAISYDSNMDMNNQRAYSYRDVLPQDPGLGQTWSQNTGRDS
jgi:E3 ubiquitin-protein ligase RAD18